MQFLLDRRQCLRGLAAIGGAAALAGVPTPATGNEVIKAVETALSGADSHRIKGIVTLLSPTGRTIKGSEKEVMFVIKPADDGNLLMVSEEDINFENLETGTISFVSVDFPEIMSHIIPMGHIGYTRGSTFNLHLE